jgi:hypothetical protein
MHTDLPRKQNWPFRAPRANFPCRIALYVRAGTGLGLTDRVVRRDPGVHSRLIRAVSTRRAVFSGPLASEKFPHILGGEGGLEAPPPG